MSDLDNRERQAYDVVDEALQTYPLSPAPITLYPSIMARIRATQTAPRFHLGWMDYALSLLAAVMAGLVIILLWNVSQQSIESARIEIWLSLQELGPALLIPMALGILITAAATLALVANSFSGPSIRPAARSR